MRATTVAIISGAFAFLVGCGGKEDESQYIGAVGGGSGSNEYGDEECYTSADCVPDNPDSCKTYWCDENYECQSGPLCQNDDDPCTVNERCEDGACLKDPKCGPDDKTCTADWCEPTTGECMHEPYDPIEPHCECNESSNPGTRIEYQSSAGKIVKIPFVKIPVGGTFDFRVSAQGEPADCPNGCTSSASAEAFGRLKLKFKDTIDLRLGGGISGSETKCMECNDDSCEFECTETSCKSSGVNLFGNGGPERMFGLPPLTFNKAGFDISFNCSGRMRTALGGEYTGNKSEPGSCQPCQSCNAWNASGGVSMRAWLSCTGSVKWKRWGFSFGCGAGQEGEECARVQGSGNLLLSHQDGQCGNQWCAGVGGDAAVTLGTGKKCVKLLFMKRIINCGALASGFINSTACLPVINPGEDGGVDYGGEVDGWCRISPWDEKLCE